MTEIHLGNLKLKGNIFLAPLAGYTDKIYRNICLKHGACLAYTEMVSAEGVFRNSTNTLTLMDRGTNETNLAVQLFMPDAQTAQRSVCNVMKYNPQLIDINCGCPVPKVTKTGAGSALLKTPHTIKEIVKVLSQDTGLPITVKIRTGWDVESMNYLEVAENAFEGGAVAVCMHARTRSQLYMPTANWEHLSILKSHFPNKVIIGSGDLFTAEDGVRMLKQTKVDAIVFARGAIGNPFIFEQAEAILAEKPIREVSISEKIDAILEHLNGLCTIMDEERACREMRKHVCAYLKGTPNSAKVRNLIMSATSALQYQSFLSQLIS